MTSPTPLSHRYHWTTEERLILAFLLLSPFVLIGLLALKQVGGLLITSGIALAVDWGLAGYLFHLGRTRKNKSKIEGELNGSQFRFTGGRFKRSAGDIADHARVTVRRSGGEQALVFSTLSYNGGSDSEVIVPARLVRQNAPGHDDLARVVRQRAADRGVQVSAEARALLDGIPTSS